FGSTSTDYISSVAVDSEGNVIVTGDYWGTVPLISPWATTFVDTTFLVKFSATGAKIWAKNFPTCGNVGTGVAVDRRINPSTGQAYDNILLSGYFQGGIDLGTGTIASLSTGGYLGKFDKDGTCLLSRNAGQTSGVANGSHAFAVAVDANGDAIVSGTFIGQADFGGGTVQGTSLGYDMYLAKYAGASGSYQWVRPVLGTYTCESYSIAADAQNNLLV